MSYTSKNEIYQMFIDGTPNETANTNRLATEATEYGTISLIAYGWQKIAEYHPETNAVRVFLGHEGKTETTDKYLGEVAEAARKRDREVIESGESPYEGQPPDCITYANEYVDWNTNLSPVERKAKSHVVGVLKGLY